MMQSQSGNPDLRVKASARSRAARAERLRGCLHPAMSAAQGRIGINAISRQAMAMCGISALTILVERIRAAMR
jgi:hypothetical protein